jgi:hypothetical protein
MASGIFDDAKGRWRTYFDNVVAGDPANSRIILAYYQAIEADSTLETRPTKTSLDAQVANTECDFDNYVVSIFTGVAQGISVGEIYADANNVQISGAGSGGGGTNNNILKAIVLYVADYTLGYADAIPLFHYDFVLTTIGVNLDFTIPSTNLHRE